MVDVTAANEECLRRMDAGEPVLVDVLPAIEPWLTWIEANPMHSLTEAWRWVLLGESAAPFARAELSADLIRFAPWALGALCLGLGSARALRAQLSDEVAA